MKTLHVFIIMVAVGLFGCNQKSKVESMQPPSNMNSNVVHLTQREQLLVNLKIDTVKLKPIYETIALLGKAVTNENKTSVISSKVKGRIDQLFVRNTGEEIKTGQALYAIYSEELLSDESEYLLTLEQQKQFTTQKSTIGDLIAASKSKLLLWGLSEEQIGELAHIQKPSPTMIYYSKTNGYLAELNISEGVYVDIGTQLFKIAQAGDVWVEAQIYPYELQYLNPSTTFSVEFESLPNKVFEGKIVFNPPAFEQNSKISYARIDVQDKTGRIKPGMMASITLKADEKEALVIPKSAITLDEMPTVWVEKEKGKYEMRMVHVGIETKNEVEVRHGLKAGEKVVSYGAYLISSAYILSNGANAMAGMQM